MLCRFGDGQRRPVQPQVFAIFEHDYRGFVECFCESTDALCWLARGEFFEWQTHSMRYLRRSRATAVRWLPGRRPSGRSVTGAERPAPCPPAACAIPGDGPAQPCRRPGLSSPGTASPSPKSASAVRRRSRLVMAWECPCGHGYGPLSPLPARGRRGRSPPPGRLRRRTRLTITIGTPAFDRSRRPSLRRCEGTLH